MLDGTWEKSPDEIKMFEADFTKDIPSADTIKSLTASGSGSRVVIYDSLGALQPAMLQMVAISGAKIQATITKGLDGMNYKIVVMSEMNSAATRFQKFFELRVRKNRRTM